MDNGKLLWALGKGGVEIIDSSVQKAIDRKRPETQSVAEKAVTSSAPAGD